MKILITGAGGGLGSYLTMLALERGHEIYATGTKHIHSSEALRDLKQQYGARLHIAEMNVEDEDQVRAVAGLIGKECGSLDGIINNAGVLLEREKTIEELDLSQVVKSFQINTVGPMRVVQQMLSLLYKGANQAIINISSEAGTIINAFPTNYAYSMSKTALNMFSERLREYLKGQDILVYAIHPGWMRTNMGGNDAPADPRDIAGGILDIMERRKHSYSKIAFIDSTGRPMPL